MTAPTVSHTASNTAVNFSTLTVSSLAVKDWKVYKTIATKEEKASVTDIADYSFAGSGTSYSSNDGGATQGTTISWTSDGTPTASGSDTNGFRANGFNTDDLYGPLTYISPGATGTYRGQARIGRYSDTTAANMFKITVSIVDSSNVLVGSDETIIYLAGVTSDTDGYVSFAATLANSTHKIKVHIQVNTQASSVFRAINLRGMWLSVVEASSTIVTLTTATLTQTAQPLVTKLRDTFTTASLKATTQPIITKLKVTTVAASLKATAQPIITKLKATATSALLKATAQSITTYQRATLTAASLTLTAQPLITKLKATCTSAVLTLTAQALTIVNSAPATIVTFTTAVLSMTPQAIVTKLKATTSAASLALTAQSLNARSTVTTVKATLSLTAQNITAKLRATLTSANLYLVPNRITLVSDAIVVLRRAARSSLSRFRKLLRLRRY